MMTFLLNLKKIMLPVFLFLLLVALGGCSKEKGFSKRDKEKYVKAYYQLNVLHTKCIMKSSNTGFSREFRTQNGMRDVLRAQRDVPVVDPWGESIYLYRGDRYSFFVGSAGSDGEFKNFKQRGVSEENGCDLIIDNHGIVYGPKDLGKWIKDYKQ